MDDSLGKELDRRIEFLGAQTQIALNRAENLYKRVEVLEKRLDSEIPAYAPTPFPQGWSVKYSNWSGPMTLFRKFFPVEATMHFYGDRPPYRIASFSTHDDAVKWVHKHGPAFYFEVINGD